MTPDSRVEVSPDVIDRTVGERRVLLDHRTGAYFALDPVGSRIWELIAETGQVSEICQRMLEEYDAPPDRVADDVLRIVRELRDRELVEVG